MNEEKTGTIKSDGKEIRYEDEVGILIINAEGFEYKIKKG